MYRRKLIAILVATVLTLGATALWSAQGDERDGDTATNIVASSDAVAGQSDGVDAPKKKGNRFGRFFKAPFKAVGKIFGGGSKEGRAERMTEKDAGRFESVGVMRVEHRRDRAEASQSTSITARDYLDEGRAALENGQLNEAIAALSRAASLEPRLAQAHSLLAVAYDRKGLRDRARDSYNRAIDINNNDAQSLNNFGYSLYLSGNYRAAVERLKRAARLAPDDERILNNLALAQCRLGKYDDAYKNFARANGEFEGRMNVAALLERMGRDEDALKHYEAARRLQPSSVALLRRLADIYQRTGRQQESDATRRSLDTAGANETARK